MSGLRAFLLGFGLSIAAGATGGVVALAALWVVGLL